MSNVGKGTFQPLPPNEKKRKKTQGASTSRRPSPKHSRAEGVKLSIGDKDEDFLLHTTVSQDEVIILSSTPLSSLVNAFMEHQSRALAIRRQFGNELLKVQPTKKFEVKIVLLGRMYTRSLWCWLRTL